MTRDGLVHLLRAAGALTGHNSFVLVGSNAIYAWHENIPDQLSISREVDLFASDVSEEESERIADLLENIGHLSQFDDTHGYFVDGVGPRTAVLPAGWRERSRIYAPGGANGVVAVVPHPEDIAASKLYAGRPKDVDWIAVAHSAGFIDLGAVEERIRLLPDISQIELAAALTLLEGIRNRTP